jgi:peroxiredoxin Q/BCP
MECNGFRDLLKGFPAGTVVLGASADTVELNQKFSDKEKYTFPLLSDPEMKLIKALGIVHPKFTTFSDRVTFVINKDGTIAKVYDKVTPKTHAEEVQKFVSGLK